MQNSSVDNAKLILLGDKAFRNWVNLNCVANDHSGVLPSLQIVALKLRVTESRAAAAIAELVAKNLFDKREDGSFVPHDWSQWQYKTDEVDPTNADRQREFRKRRRKEFQELKELRDKFRNGELRNTVTPVTAKRSEADTDILPTARVGRGPSSGEYEGTVEFKNSLRRFEQ